jgi:O-antigen ligase
MAPGARRWSATIAAALPVVVVTAADPRGWSPYGPAKWLAVSVVAAAAITTTLGSARVIVVPRLMVRWGALLAIAAIAAAVGLDRRYAWIGTGERHLGVVTWVAFAAMFMVGVANASSARTVILGTLTAGGVLGLGAVAELAGYRVVDLSAATDRLTVGFGSGAFLGAASALLLPIAGAVAVGSRQRRVRVLAFAVCLGISLCLGGSGARAAWLGAIAAVAAVAWLRRADRWPRTRTLVLGFTALLGAAVLAAVLSGSASRASTLTSTEAGGLRGRLDEWNVAAHVVAARPLLGTGPEGYRIAATRQISAAYERAHGRTVTPDRAHSAPLDVLASLGVVGLATWIALIAGVARHLRRALRSDRPWLWGTAAGLLAYGIQQLALFPVAELDLLAWLLAGLVVGATADPAEFHSWSRGRVGSAVVMAGVCAVAVGTGMLDVAADRSARTALSAADAGRFSAALVAADHAAALRPDAARYRIVVADVAGRTGTISATRHGLSALEGARRWSPRDPAVGVRRAQLLGQLADETDVAADRATALRAALDLTASDPNNAQVWLLVGAARQRNGEVDAAVTAWERAAHLAPRSVAPLVNVALLEARSGRTAGSVDAARRVLALDPTNRVAQVIVAGSVP